MSTTLEHIRSMNIERASVSMAVGIVVDRLSRLDKDDRNDLFRLAKALPTAQTEEEQEAIYTAMLEILEQTSSGIRTMPEPRMDAGKKLEKWKQHVAAKVRQLRMAAGLTQEDLAKAAKLPQSHVSRIEQAHLAPSSRTIDRIADALSAKPGDIDPSR